MKVRRNIASIPVRSAGETWSAIVDLITGKDSVDRTQFEAAASVMETLIADEQPASVPIVLKGSGPCLLLYCIYQEDAMEAGLAVDTLTWNPTAGDWCITAPSEREDVKWMNRTLQIRAPRIIVHAADQAAPTEVHEEITSAEQELQIEWGNLQEP